MKRLCTLLILIFAINTVFALPYLSRGGEFPNHEGMIVFEGNYAIPDNTPDGDFVACIKWTQYGYISIALISMDTDAYLSPIFLGHEDECTLTPYLKEIYYYSNSNTTKFGAWVQIAKI